MDIENVLVELLNHYTRSRMVGHSYNAINGIKGNKGFFIVGYSAIRLWADTLIGRKATLTLTDIDCYRLRGLYTEPLSFDNSALVEIFRSVLRKFDELSIKLSKANLENNKLKNELIASRKLLKDSMEKEAMLLIQLEEFEILKNYYKERYKYERSTSTD